MIQKSPHESVVMKKSLLAIATLGLTLTAFGQGAVIIDNNNAPGYLDIYRDGNHYSGSFGLEVWYKNASAADNAINSLNGIDGQAANAYALLTADGFSLATTIPNCNSAGGIFAIREVDIKAPAGTVPAGQAGPGLHRTVNGGSVLLAIVIWQGTGSSYIGAPNGGIVTFVNPTWTIPPPSTPVPPFTDNFGGNGAPYTDLIMAVPEPRACALVGLGTALWLAFRRRKVS
jgi:hypothetical protein